MKGRADGRPTKSPRPRVRAVAGPSGACRRPADDLLDDRREPAGVSGLITDGFLAGQYFSSSAQDNGTAAKDPVDQIGRTIISDGPLDCSAKDDVELADAPDGQVTVR